VRKRSYPPISVLCKFYSHILCDFYYSSIGPIDGSRLTYGVHSMPRQQIHPYTTSNDRRWNTCVYSMTVNYVFHSTVTMANNIVKSNDQ
jgi:hypothetical protein